MSDIFEFWSQIRRGERVHPADKEVFARINPQKHGFQLNCLPGCFAGRLRSAKIVLLYLSPGFDETVVADAESEEGKDYRLRSWAGDEPLRTTGPGRDWVASRTQSFGAYENIQSELAILNIGAYHSKDVKSYASLLALPSSRVSLAWAQNTLFPEAESGKRIVICMRSAAYWGLETGRPYSGHLFAPRVTRHGHFLKNDENLKLIDVVRARLKE